MILYLFWLVTCFLCSQIIETHLRKWHFDFWSNIFHSPQWPHVMPREPKYTNMSLNLLFRSEVRFKAGLHSCAACWYKVKCAPFLICLHVLESLSACCCCWQPAKTYSQICNLKYYVLIQDNRSTFRYIYYSIHSGVILYTSEKLNVSKQCTVINIWNTVIF